MATHFRRISKKAHCDAALETMVSVENAGKLFERAGGGRIVCSNG